MAEDPGENPKDMFDRMKADIERLTGHKPLSLATMTPPTPTGVAGAVEYLLEELGQDTRREGLQETPARVARFYERFLNPEPFKLTTFENDGSDELIVQVGIPFYSLCEHHLLPFMGMAVVGYIPSARIVGLSKLARLVQFHASGLQNQERITQQVSASLDKALTAQGVGVVLKARHLCMEMRGVKAVGAETITSSLQGALRTDPRSRSEFLRLAGL